MAQGSDKKVGISYLTPALAVAFLADVGTAVVVVVHIGEGGVIVRVVASKKPAVFLCLRSKKKK